VGHPERSKAKSKDPAVLSRSNATGFLDFARNDILILTVQPLQRDFNLRPARAQCHVQSRKHHFYFHGLVLHSARRVAPPYGVHDHSIALVCLFSGRLHRLSRACWREIFRIHRLDRGVLLSDPRLARSAGICDAAAGHFDACSSFSSQMGSTQADRTLDDPNLAVRVGDWRSSLFNALPVVSSTRSLKRHSIHSQSGVAANQFDLKILRSTPI
jgi:hypothetical protein